MADETYCGWGCYGEAKKHGRPVRTVNIDGKEMRLCSLCESRARNGLVRLSISNGTEHMMFEERCDRCRHGSYHEGGWIVCKWGIADRIAESAWEENDSAKHWWDPAIIQTHDNGRPLCPPRCLKFIDRNDPNGAATDPPPKDCEGQLTFDDIDVPVERVPQRASEVSR